MFATEHFEGRMRYETDKIACIDVYAQPTFDVNRPFVVQVYVALNTCKCTIPEVSISFGETSLTKTHVRQELNEGVEQFFKMRENLGLMPSAEQEVSI